MENVLAKSPENRRGKFLVIGLVVVICVLSLQVYQQHILKKNLIRRKAFLLERLRESKAAESKSTYTLKLKILEVQDQKKKIDAKSQEIENVKKDLTSLTNDYNKKINDLQKLRTSAVSTET